MGGDRKFRRGSQTAIRGGGPPLSTGRRPTLPLGLKRRFRGPGGPFPDGFLSGGVKEERLHSRGSRTPLLPILKFRPSTGLSNGSVPQRAVCFRPTGGLREPGVERRGRLRCLPASAPRNDRH